MDFNASLNEVMKKLRSDGNRYLDAHPRLEFQGKPILNNRANLKALGIRHGSTLELGRAQLLGGTQRRVDVSVVMQDQDS